MDKFNILENRNYFENYDLITKCLKEKDFKILFKIQKCINRNKDKKRFISEFIKKDWRRNDILEILDFKFSRQLFQAFIISKHKYDKNNTFNHLKCYDMCVDSLTNSRKIFFQHYVDSFLEVTPTFSWEKRVKECFRYSFMGNKETIQRLKKRCIKEIKKSIEMKQFREALESEIEWITEERKTFRKSNKRIIDKLLILMNKTKTKRTEL